MLLTVTTMPLADVKSCLSELVGRVQAHHERVTVTVHGRPSAVLIAVADLEALQERLSVLSNPDILRRLVESDAELARGEVAARAELVERGVQRSRRQRLGGAGEPRSRLTPRRERSIGATMQTGVQPVPPETAIAGFDFRPVFLEGLSATRARGGHKATVTECETSTIDGKQVVDRA